MHPGRALVHMTRTVRWFRNYPVGADEQLELEPPSLAGAAGRHQWVVSDYPVH